MSEPFNLGFQPVHVPVPEGYPFLQSKLKELTGIDLTHYKERQMLRRLVGYLSRVGETDFLSLAQRIDKNPDDLQALRDFIMINVSEFFRNPDRFQVLAQEVLPELRQRFGPLRIWSAGTSVGAEAYSVAILLHEMGLRPGDVIFATDVDRSAIAEAREGIYGPEMLKEVSPERKNRYFQSVAPGKWQIKDEIKSVVRLEIHDLLKDPYPEDIHLILCRNVLIYLTDPAKDQIYRGFSQVLQPGGYLLIGSTESIFSPHQFSLETAGLFLYRRKRE